MDVDSIRAGADFFEAIDHTLKSCNVLLAIIGRRWLEASDEYGRRLDNPDDLVRHEISTALNNGILVIPILVGGSVMPRSSDLPDELIPLGRRNAIGIRHESFHKDTERLIEAIQSIIDEDNRRKLKAEAEAKQNAVEEERRKQAEEETRKPGEDEEAKTRKEGLRQKKQDSQASNQQKIRSEPTLDRPPKKRSSYPKTRRNRNILVGLSLLILTVTIVSTQIGANNRKNIDDIIADGNSHSDNSNSPLGRVDFPRLDIRKERVEELLEHSTKNFLEIKGIPIKNAKGIEVFSDAYESKLPLTEYTRRDEMAWIKEYDEYTHFTHHYYIRPVIRDCIDTTETSCRHEQAARRQLFDHVRARFKEILDNSWYIEENIPGSVTPEEETFNALVARKPYDDKSEFRIVVKFNNFESNTQFVQVNIMNMSYATLDEL